MEQRVTHQWEMGPTWSSNELVSLLVEAQNIGIKDGKGWINLGRVPERPFQALESAQGIGDVGIGLDDALEGLDVIGGDLNDKLNWRPNPGEVVGSVRQDLYDFRIVFQPLEERFEASGVSQRLACRELALDFDCGFADIVDGS